MKFSRGGKGRGNSEERGVWGGVHAGRESRAGGVAEGGDSLPTVI